MFLLVLGCFFILYRITCSCSICDEDAVGQCLGLLPFYYAIITYAHFLSNMMSLPLYYDVTTSLL